MFDFIRKATVWEALDKGYAEELKGKNISYQLKHAQDLAVYRHLRDLVGQDIAEIGGGNSRVLERLALNNRCVNIEKFEGKHLGPTGVIPLSNVQNVSAYVGEFDELLRGESFDLIFSISVVEHVETEKLDDFFRDSLRILKPGGKFLHAIDMYLDAEPSNYVRDRFERYRTWLTGFAGVLPIGPVHDGPPTFKVDMTSNPDNILYGWNKLVPSLARLRANAQNVSLIVGGMKRP